MTHTDKSASEQEIARGLRGVIFTETRLSAVDGQAGKLVIGGFAVEELAPKASFEEVLHLLWHDRLPNQEELSELRRELVARRALPEVTLTVLRHAAKHKLPPMDALRVGVDTLSLADEEPNDLSRPANLRRAMHLVAALPNVLAAYWRLLQGLEPVPPQATLSHAANFLATLHGEEPHPEAARALETYFNTVIDHGVNNSTFTARVIASTRSDMVSAVVGAVGALKGPLHGGAPGPAMDMVFEIRRRAEALGRSVAEEAEAWVRERLAQGERIMGFGHRVYRVRDPRADVLGKAANALFTEKDTQLYDDAKAVEAAALRLLNAHKPGRSLQTNVEFYTALVLHGVGLSAPLFSSVFALARAGGWTAHILEQIDEDELIRPSSAYCGARGHTYAPPA